MQQRRSSPWCILVFCGLFLLTFPRKPYFPFRDAAQGCPWWLRSTPVPGAWRLRELEGTSSLWDTICLPTSVIPACAPGLSSLLPAYLLS